MSALGKIGEVNWDNLGVNPAMWNYWVSLHHRLHGPRLEVTTAMYAGKFTFTTAFIMTYLTALKKVYKSGQTHTKTPVKIYV